jgi:asparaginyl-tRNA synthetase
MARTKVCDCLSGTVSLGTEVTIQGWVRSRRDSKAGMSFLVVHDGSGFDALQAVVPNTLANYVEEVQKLTTGCSVEVTGNLIESQGKGQSVELDATNVTVVGWVEDPETYPMQQKRHSFEYLRDQAHLRARTNTFGAMARVRNCLAQSIHRYFHSRGFLWIHTPIITTSDAEGAGELFRVSTLDSLNPARSKDGSVDFSQDFCCKETFLAVT